MKDRLQALAPNGETRIAVAACGFGHAVGEADLRGGDVPELARLKRQIAGFGECLWQNQRVAQQAIRKRLPADFFPFALFCAFRRGLVVSGDAVLMR